jgi:hypothetical protein
MRRSFRYIFSDQTIVDQDGSVIARNVPHSHGMLLASAPLLRRRLQALADAASPSGLKLLMDARQDALDELGDLDCPLHAKAIKEC